MRTWTRIAVAAVAILTVVGCGSETVETTTTTMPDDSGRLYGPGEVTLEVGQSIDVILAANPTTGYTWSAAVGDDAVATVGEPFYEPDANPQGMSGAGGTSTFTITAVGPGRTEVVLSKAREWEEGVDPVEQVTVTVTVP